MCYTHSAGLGWQDVGECGKGIVAHVTVCVKMMYVTDDEKMCRMIEAFSRDSDAEALESAVRTVRQGAMHRTDGVYASGIW